MFLEGFVEPGSESDRCEPKPLFGRKEKWREGK